MSLDKVEHCDGLFTPLDELFYDPTTEKAAAADDEERFLRGCRGGHRIV